MTDRAFVWPGFDPADARHSTLHGWLVLDIQHQPAIARELLERTRQLRRGGALPAGGCGNGYEYDFLDAGLELACLYPGDDQSPVTVPYPVVETALEAWLEWLLSDKR